MRGGTSKGVFFRLQDLPEAARVPGPARDALLLRVIGSPDPYAKQIDGMGGATSSTSKAVIVERSGRYPISVEMISYARSLVIHCMSSHAADCLVPQTSSMCWNGTRSRTRSEAG